MYSRYSVEEFRESWCILSIEVDNTEPLQLKSWEIGDGNMNQLVRTEASSTHGAQTQEEICETLGEVLDIRRHSSRLLITDGQETIDWLREVLLLSEGIRYPTLRGFRHVSVSETLAEYFDRADSSRLSEEISKTSLPRHTTDIAGPVADLWQLWSTIAPLLPVAALRGREL